jgi:CheY-like chemotaxis protein
MLPRPDLTLLDLNMPRMDGREVLAQIKKDDNLRTIPIAILTTSDSESDIAKSYRLHANCYLCKPAQLSAFESRGRRPRFERGNSDRSGSSEISGSLRSRSH